MIDVVDSNAVYYYHFDGLGSVVALSDENGSVIESYSYDAFGEPNTTSTVGNRFMFTGREYDSETGLYHYRARAYRASIGRFLQTDPIGYTDSMNLYQYCRSNPVSFIDPLGLKIVIVGDEAVFQQAHTYLSSSPTYKATYNYLESQPDTYYITTNSQQRNGYDGNANIHWDPSAAVTIPPVSDIEPDNKTMSPALVVAHELEHLKEYVKNGKLDATPLNNGYDNKEEQRVIVGPERKIAMELGEPLRHSHKAGECFHVDNPTKRCKK